MLHSEALGASSFLGQSRASSSIFSKCPTYLDLCGTVQRELQLYCTSRPLAMTPEDSASASANSFITYGKACSIELDIPATVQTALHLVKL